MPIGKSAIKRVSGSGYANIKNEAPDMEHSTVVAVDEKRAVPVSKKIANNGAKKPAAKKTEAAKPAKKSTAEKAAKPAAKKAAEKTVKPAARKNNVKKPAVVADTVIPRGAETAVKIKQSLSASENNEKGYYNLGEDMPVYLL